MATQVYSVLGAGVDVVVEDASPSVRSGALGTVLMVMPAAKGVPGLTRRIRGDFRRRFGRVLEDDWGGVAADAFNRVSQGAGQLFGLRVTTGGRQQVGGGQKGFGNRAFFSRDILTSRLQADSQTKERTRALSGEAMSLGDWAGPRFEFAGFFDDSGISGTTINLGSDFEMLFDEDELVDCQFEIVGFDTKPKIAAHEDTGGNLELTIDRPLTGYVPAGTVLFRITRQSVDKDGNAMEATVRISSSPSDPSGKFDIEVKVDGQPSLGGGKFTNIDLNDLATTLDRPWEKAVRAGYEDVAFDDDDGEIGDKTLSESRPANLTLLPVQRAFVDFTDSSDGPSDFGTPDDGSSSSSTKVFFQVAELILDTAAAGSRPRLEAAPTIPSTCIPHVYELTFTGAAAFSVRVFDPYTGEDIVPASQAPAGATGAAYPGVAMAHPDLATFTVEVDGGINAGAVVRLWVTPLPANLRRRNVSVYTAAFSGSGRVDDPSDPGFTEGTPSEIESMRVLDNGADWVKLAGNIRFVQPPKEPFAVGSDTSNSHDTTGGAETFKYQVKVDGVIVEGPTTHTIPDNGVRTSAQLVADLNTLEDAADDLVNFFLHGNNQVACVLKNGDAGPDVVLEVLDGTINASVGLADDTEHAGLPGSPVAFDFDQGLKAARQEHTVVSTTDLQEAFAPGTPTEPNAIESWIKAWPGLVHVYMPGVTDFPTLQVAADFLDGFGAKLLFDAPADVESMAEFADRIRVNLVPNQSMRPLFPSWGNAPSTPRGELTVPLGGAWLGAMAGLVNDRAIDGVGFHKAMAGMHFRLSPYVDRLVTGQGIAQPDGNVQAIVLGMPLDEVTANGIGITGLRQRGANVHGWTARGINPNFAGTFWHHKWDTSRHVVALLRANHQELLFLVNDGGLAADIIASVRSLMKPMWKAGAFMPLKDGDPDDFENCVAIQCDDTLNPSEVTDLGKRICAVSFRVVNTTEKIEFQVGTQGISAPAT